MVSLPNDMVAEVLARVAASSITDLCSCKLSCNSLRQIAKDKDVLQRVSLEKVFSVFSWHRRKDAEKFLIECQNSDNPEALFHAGVVQWLRDVRVEEGIENLERAASLSHKGAAYALGIILLCSGDEACKQKGMKLINDLKSKLVDCRRKLRDVVRMIFGIRNDNILRNKPTFYCMQVRHKKCMICPWKAKDYEDDEVDNLLCEGCRCNREIKFFHEWLPQSITS
ncbi:hypothetical protein Ancab_002760 [Ancistrocladus abbreviatus]